MLVPVVIELTVVNGSSPGKTARFDGRRITLGRDRGNDFPISDSFVSSFHGEIRLQPHGYVYTDLNSRHGTTVSIRDEIVQLNGENNGARSCYLGDGAHIQLGETVLQLNVGLPARLHRKPNAHETWKPRFRELVEEESSASRTLHAVPSDLLARNFQRRDPRLKLLMHLSSQLNGQNRLPEILDLIVEATFVAFPLTHCFYIGLLDEGLGLVPFVTQFNAETEACDPDTVLSPILLTRVAESRHPILYVRGADYGPLSMDFLDGPTSSSMYVPLRGQHKLLGVITITSRSRDKLFSTQDLELFSVLASNVAFALERAKLTENIYEMFEGFVRASVVAIEDRDPTTAGHSERVAAYTIALAEAIDGKTSGELSDLRFSRDQLTELRYAALLHDFGKVGVRESVLNKAKRLSDNDYELICQRFATFKERQWRWLLSSLVERACDEQRAPSRDELSGIQDQHGTLARRLDGIVAFIDQVRHAKRLDEETIARIHALREEVLEVGEDDALKLFRAHELRDMSIPYGTLNRDEWEDMRSHASRTEYFLSQIPWSSELRSIPCIAGAHHEKLDGSGYPNGLRGKEILPQVRIMTIADIFDALTANDRPYRKACSVEDAVDILWSDAERDHLDARFVSLFVKQVLPSVVHLVPGHDA